MKHYTINARMRKDTDGLSMVLPGYEDVTECAVNQFPVNVEANNKDAAKEIAQAIVRDVGLIDDRYIIYTITIGW